MQDPTAAQVKKDLESVSTLSALEEVKRLYLGPKGSIKLRSKELGKLPVEERKAEGQKLTTLYAEVEKLFTEKEDELANLGYEQKIVDDAEQLTYSLPKIGHLHPITQTIRKMNAIFESMGYSVMEGPEIETDEYNFQRMNVPKDHPARGMQDTIYVSEPEHLLRTQTSSIEARILESYKPPMKIVIPGKVYRNEKVNRSNHFVFHQYQGVVVLERTSLQDLFGTFTQLFKGMYGDDVIVRYRSKFYPEVEPGAGCDMQCFNCKGKGCAVCKYVGWIEMGGSGIIHPEVLAMAGIDKDKWMGFAFGLGLDRWVMANYKIDDIRSLLGGGLAYHYYQNENTL
jgi:phenylalanyl-tRNA synthetase alpha chain